MRKCKPRTTPRDMIPPRHLKDKTQITRKSKSDTRTLEKLNAQKWKSIELKLQIRTNGETKLENRITSELKLQNLANCDLKTAETDHQ